MVNHRKPGPGGLGVVPVCLPVKGCSAIPTSGQMHKQLTATLPETRYRIHRYVNPVHRCVKNLISRSSSRFPRKEIAQKFR